MAQTDAASLETLEFSGLNETSLLAAALASREGLDLFVHEHSYVRRRVVRSDPTNPAIIFLPDGPATIESYDNVIQRLKGEFTIVLIEIPGLGFSFPKSSEAMDFELISQIVAAAIIDLELYNSVLVGCCFNGLIAARVAQITPESFAGIIIAQTGDFKAEQNWFDEVLDPTGDLKKPFEGQVYFRLRREDAALRWWVPYSGGPKLDVDTFQREGRKVFDQGCCYGLATMIQKWGSSSMPTTPDLTQTIPTCIVWGEADKSHAHTDKDSICLYAPDASVIKLPDVGHFPDLEAPDVIAAQARKLFIVGK